MLIFRDFLFDPGDSLSLRALALTLPVETSLGLKLASPVQVYGPPPGLGGWYRNRKSGVQAYALYTFNRVPGFLSAPWHVFLEIGGPLPSTWVQVSASSARISRVVRVSFRGPGHHGFHVPGWVTLARGITGHAPLGLVCNLCNSHPQPLVLTFPSAQGGPGCGLPLTRFPWSLSSWPQPIPQAGWLL